MMMIVKLMTIKKTIKIKIVIKIIMELFQIKISKFYLRRKIILIMKLQNLMKKKISLIIKKLKKNKRMKMKINNLMRMIIKRV